MNSHLQAVENYITSDDDLSEGELEWRSLLVQLPDLVSAMLIGCHTSSQKLKHFKAHTFYLIGRCYRLISQIKYQLKKFNLANARPNESFTIAVAISNWSPSIVELIRIQQQNQIESELSKSKAKQSKNPSVMRTESNAGLLSETGHASSVYGSQGNAAPMAGLAIESDHEHIAETSTITNIVDQEYLKVKYRFGFFKICQTWSNEVCVSIESTFDSPPERVASHGVLTAGLEPSIFD